MPYNKFYKEIAAIARKYRIPSRFLCRALIALSGHRVGAIAQQLDMTHGDLWNHMVGYSITPQKRERIAGYFGLEESELFYDD